MSKANVAVIAGLAGFLLGGAGVFVAFATLKSFRTAQEWNQDSLAGLGERVESMDRALTDLTRRVNELDRDPKDAANPR